MSGKSGNISENNIKTFLVPIFVEEFASTTICIE